MPLFTYSALGPSGMITGELTASDRGEAFALLGKKKIQPIKLEAASEVQTTSKAKTKASAEPLPGGLIKLKLAQVVLFIEELADLVSA
ncbi:MAG: hypothetical protein ACK5TH_22815, partial [Prosthecobacter sp.]